MTVINGMGLHKKAPIRDMLDYKDRCPRGVSRGLVEVGYDIAIKQTIKFVPMGDKVCIERWDGMDMEVFDGRFCLASAKEEFIMPPDLMGIVHDKSTWARQGLSVFNTVIEPAWHGFLTLELVFHGNEPVTIPAGSGIAQVIFHKLELPAYYGGQYQNQPDQPTGSKLTEI
jgi:dCTP deaminase